MEGTSPHPFAASLVNGTLGWPPGMLQSHRIVFYRMALAVAVLGRDNICCPAAVGKDYKCKDGEGFAGEQHAVQTDTITVCNVTICHSA